MKLQRLRLRNFRQHADTDIRFREGLTGIIGPNGAGKSTLLEAIAWAIYGSPAARGTNDTLRFSRAEPRSHVRVELEFSLGGHEYRVARTMSSAEVCLDGAAAPVAATLTGATEYLQRRIGMTREEFFNTYFTGQKELQFLASMGAADRGRFFSRVLGYERLRRAQELARVRRNELRRETDALRAALGDADRIAADRREAETAVGAADGALKAAAAALEGAEETLRALAPRWEAAQAARDRFRELTHAAESAGREREGARRDLARADADLERVAAAEAELASLRGELEALPAAEAEVERLAELSRAEDRRRALAERIGELEKEVAEGEERLEKVRPAPELARRYAAELAELRERRAALDSSVGERREAWLRDKQDAQTKLGTYRERAAELQAQIRQIRELGPEGTCPTCGRPVGDDYERLLDEMEDQLADVTQDGKWWRSRAEQLEARPEELAEEEAELRALGERIDAAQTRLVRCEKAVEELERLGADQARRRERLDALRAEREALPTGYEAAAYRAAEARLRALRETATRAARLEEQAGRRAELERDRAAAAAREAEAADAQAAALREREALGFAPEAFDALRAEYEGAARARQEAEVRVVDQRGRLAAAEERLAAARRAEEEHRERMRDVREREESIRYHEELDAAFSELRAELNDQVRPELSEIASDFLAQLTDGRYTAMEIDAGYDVTVLDEGEVKPVISGGEEDVANLVLRLSLSQMIAERAGHPLSLLILDEVFGSLDVARRDNVVQLLHLLEDRFEQVIVITHVEGIRESLDQVLRVDFDERTGTSVVREERPGGGDLPTEMAAD